MLLSLVIIALTHAAFGRCERAESDFAVAASLSLTITLGLDCVEALRTVAIRLWQCPHTIFGYCVLILTLVRAAQASKMDSQRAARIATFSVGIAVASYAAYQLGKLVQRKRHDAKNSTSCVELRPPFPDEVVQLLRSSVLCYLSTLADGAPHLSLMNFTYCPADEKIIMSTRRDTTKYRALLKNKRVAVLIHDFPAEERQRAAAASARAAGHSGDYAQTYSVTLYGSVQVETGAAAERYRAMHLERNGAGQRQFIVGDNIGIITVLVDKARICNQADKVRIWDASAPVVQSPSECDVDSPKSA